MNPSKILFFLTASFLLFISINCQEDNNDDNDDDDDDEPPRRRIIRRRSQKQQQNICRREFLRSIDKRIGDVDLVFKGIVEKVYTSPKSDNTDVVEDDDDNTVLDGNDSGSDSSVSRKRQVHPMALYRQRRQHNNKNGQQQDSPSANYRSIVRVKRVYKGSREGLQGSLVIVEGFGSSSKICDSDVKAGDVRIFLVNRALFGRMKLNSSLLKVTPENTRKVISATKHRCHHFYSRTNEDKPDRDREGL